MLKFYDFLIEGARCPRGTATQQRLNRSSTGTGRVIFSGPVPAAVIFSGPVLTGEDRFRPARTGSDRHGSVWTIS